MAAHSGTQQPSSMAMGDGLPDIDAMTNTLNSSQWGMYINYADPTMNRTYAQDVYWRQNVPRLQTIKAALDPNEVFYFPQAIQPKK